MKKTIAVLLAFSGISFGADYTLDPVWQINFGSGYTGGYEKSGELDNLGTVYDVADHVTAEGVTTGSSHRPHLNGGVYGSWDDNFQFAVTLTLGDPIATNTGGSWPVFAYLSGNGTDLRFGPYVDAASGNAVHLDGNLTKDTTHSGLVKVSAGEKYTVTLTKIGNDVTLAVNGITTSMGTLADTVSGNITDITLGGDTGSGRRLNETVHSISWSRVDLVPEPTTATLSLLALAGLCARRRRK